MTKEQYDKIFNKREILEGEGWKQAQEAWNNGEHWLQKGYNWVSGKVSDLWKGLTGQTSAEATIKANEMNIANQNYWNEKMMEREDTAHQREMADLQAAGLNPWLSVGSSGAAANGLNAAQAEPADGSKMLQATTAMALLAITKILGRNTTRTNFNFKR